MLDAVLDHLRTLVAADTTNPPRVITRAHPAVAHAQLTLDAAGFTVDIEDLGDGCLNLLATRGAPDLLFNCHLDTVPADSEWAGDPHELRIESGRAIGLGACDIKGAAACLLAAATASKGDAAILLTTDEEAGTSRCVRMFAPTCVDRFEGVVVAEPTGCVAVTAHRGLLSGEVVFRGTGGHASGGGASSALHDLVRWGTACASASELAAHRFNLGRVEGGEKANMIASLASARFGFRAAPESETAAILRAVQAAAPEGSRCEWATRFEGPALAPRSVSPALAERLGVEVGAPVDFWTEAAIFAGAGIPAIVFGPGDIAQAHAAGEHVALEQLERAAHAYCTVFAGVKEGAAS